MLINIFGRLGSVNYKLLAGTNIKGGTDSLFFIHDRDYRVSPADFCIVSLNKNDRLRLVNCVEMADVVRQVVIRNYGEIQKEEDKYGSWEFKLPGYPWNCSGHEAIRSRRLISRVSEAMLAHGWALTNAIDISRSTDDKSVLLYTRCQPLSTNFACLALSDVDRIRLLDFPPAETSSLKTCLVQNYMPGVQKEEVKDERCHQLDFIGSPWTQSSSFGIHARTALMHAMKVICHDLSLHICQY